MIEASKDAPYHNKLPFGFIKSFVRPTSHLLQLILNKVLADRCKVVGKYHTLDMVVLVLDYTRGLSGKLLVVLNEVLVEVAHTNRYRAAHILVEAGQR